MPSHWDARLLERSFIKDDSRRETVKNFNFNSVFSLLISHLVAYLAHIELSSYKQQSIIRHP